MSRGKAAQLAAAKLDRSPELRQAIQEMLHEPGERGFTKLGYRRSAGEPELGPPELAALEMRRKCFVKYKFVSFSDSVSVSDKRKS